MRAKSKGVGRWSAVHCFVRRAVAVPVLARVSEEPRGDQVADEDAEEEDDDLGFGEHRLGRRVLHIWYVETKLMIEVNDTSRR